MVSKEFAKLSAGKHFVEAFNREDLIALRDRLSVSTIDNGEEFIFIFAKDEDGIVFTPFTNNETMPTIMMEIAVNKTTGATKKIYISH